MILPVQFVKAHACGNDFLIIDGGYAPADISDFSRRICDRHCGVGADGVEWLFPDNEADIHARLYNADGTLAEISGNGTRCVAAHLATELKKEEIVIRTDAGVKTCTLTARSGSRFEFETAMGEPQVKDELSINAVSGQVRGVPVSMGNPHFVVFVPEFNPHWQAEGAEIGSYQDFKEGMNVEFVKVRDKQNIEVRFFERGVGETQSSGTGSCASAVAAIATKKTASSVRVHAPGGMQIVRWEKEVFLRGPAEIICRGDYFA
ncbi:MAG TPA: diaminopimelate epimerase [Terriglobales bacterium]|jgi:diaminopimelate epimerase